MEAVAELAQEGLRDCGLSPCYAEARRALDAKSGQEGTGVGGFAHFGVFAQGDAA